MFGKIARKFIKVDYYWDQFSIFCSQHSIQISQRNDDEKILCVKIEEEIDKVLQRYWIL